jgi:hypothetical protein
LVVEFDAIESTIRLERNIYQSDNQGVFMKFICLGCLDEKRWAKIPASEQLDMVDDCFAYDDELRKHGHFAGGEALGPALQAKTLRWQQDKVVITDGPYAETKEMLGGILILEARDMAHAVELMSKHPGVKMGSFEIRPAADLTGMIQESEQRRKKN